MSVSFQEHVALFGGSFNPPHLGHVQAVQDLLENPKVARVVILPSFKTPLKVSHVPFPDRLEMAKIAFPRFTVSSIEEQEKIDYTWQLLTLTASQYAKAAFVIGTDQFANLEKWGRFPDVLGMSDWIVLIRQPETLSESNEAISKFTKLGLISATSDSHTFDVNVGGSKRCLRFVATKAQALSSTEIREQFALGKKEKVKSLLPEGVYSFIERKKLYGT